MRDRFPAFPWLSLPHRGGYSSSDCPICVGENPRALQHQPVCRGRHSPLYTLARGCDAPGGDMTERDRDVDVVVIGMGPGGEHAAGTLAEAGLAVAGVEGRLVGGECPYWGCVPSKMMIRAADLITEGRRIPGMAGRAEIVPDWAPVARRIRDEATDDWDDTVAADRFAGKGGILVRGHGRITAPGEVTVTPAGGPAAGETQVLRARLGIVIATGTTAAVPPIPGLAGTPFWTNHEAI